MEILASIILERSIAYCVFCSEISDIYNLLAVISLDTNRYAGWPSFSDHSIEAYIVFDCFEIGIRRNLAAMSAINL